VAIDWVLEFFLVGDILCCDFFIGGQFLGCWDFFHSTFLGWEVFWGLNWFLRGWSFANM